jgi:ComF family protein
MRRALPRYFDALPCDLVHCLLGSCPICRTPGHRRLCRSCLWRSEAGARHEVQTWLEQFHAVFRYEDRRRPHTPSPVAQLLLRYKYHGDRGAGRVLCSLIERQVLSPLPAMDYVVPVPLHPAKLRQRGFNQTTALARRISRLTGRRLCFRALRRCRGGTAQAGASRLDRQLHIRGAFQATRSLLLVDDVLTTGATLTAAARALGESGAAGVWGWALLRAVGPIASGR